MSCDIIGLYMTMILHQIEPNIIVTTKFREYHPEGDHIADSEDENHVFLILSIIISISFSISSLFVS